MQSNKENSPTVLIALGNEMDINGQLNRESTSRLALVADIEKNSPSHLLIMCGWAYRDDSNITIAVAMKSYLSSILPDVCPKIITQSLSRDTVGDAYFSRLMLDNILKINQPNIVVVTSNYHQQRTLEIFEFIFHGYAGKIRVRGCNICYDKQVKVKAEQLSTEAFRKTFATSLTGDMYSIYNCLSLHHPYYNGIKHPRIQSISAIISDLTEQLNR